MSDRETEEAFAAYLRAEIDGALMPIAGQLGMTRDEYEEEVWRPLPVDSRDSWYIRVELPNPLKMHVSAEQALINAPLYAAIERDKKQTEFRAWLRTVETRVQAAT